MRSLAVATALLLSSCSGSDGSEVSKSCEPSCRAGVHFVGKAGIPVDANSVTVGICHAEACVELDAGVPATKTSDSAGADPTMTVSIERTSDAFAQDLQGVFVFDATWSSATRRIADGDYVVFTVTAPDGGNVITVGHTVRPEDTTDACGCGQLELSH